MDKLSTDHRRVNASAQGGGGGPLPLSQVGGRRRPSQDRPHFREPQQHHNQQQQQQGRRPRFRHAPPPPVRRKNSQHQSPPQRRGERRNDDGHNIIPSYKIFVCLMICNGGLIYCILQLWLIGLVKVHENMIISTPSSLSRNPALQSKHHGDNDVPLSSLFPGHKFRTNATKTPIIVVGLPKAGTSTIFEFFNCHGYYSQHWYCCRQQLNAQNGGPTTMAECMLWNLHAGFPILKGCGDYDVYTEMNGPKPPTKRKEEDKGKPPTRQERASRGIFLPQHYHLQELHDYSPNSIWILNVRPVNDWIESVLKIDGQTLLRQLIVEVQSHNKTSMAKTPKGRIEARNFLQEFWDRHLHLVHDFVSKHTTHQLITVNISDSNAGIDLSKSLGWSVKQQSRSEACWGHHNARDKKDTY